jgi:hypothetical protein
MPETKKTLSSDDLAAIASYKKACDVEKLNHADTKAELEKCQLEQNPPFYQDPHFYYGAGAGAAAVIVIRLIIYGLAGK